MPQYGRFRYGALHKYGRYVLSTDDPLAIGPHVRYKIRTINKDGANSEFVTMATDRVTINGPASDIRMKCNNGEWVYTHTVDIQGNIYKVRVRSITKESISSSWVYGERADLTIN